MVRSLVRSSANRDRLARKKATNNNAGFSELPNSLYAQGQLTVARFTSPTEAQAAVLPQALRGKDALATAQTGTGKTLAFVIPIIEHFLKHSTAGITALVLVPTFAYHGR